MLTLNPDQEAENYIQLDERADYTFEAYSVAAVYDNGRSMIETDTSRAGLDSHRKLRANAGGRSICTPVRRRPRDSRATGSRRSPTRAGSRTFAKAA